MSQTITATFQDGVLKPDMPLGLAPGVRVRVTLHSEVDDLAGRKAAFAELERYRKEHPINSGGLRLTRDQLQNAVDTNVLIYYLDQHEAVKQAKAVALLTHLCEV